ncbi:MAG: class I SAM-dependent methyltransferase [Oscillospiraceae bacterium]|jgi:SAM-dependent methyltransferase|nr:class I SAM-dependent methyltransferase [Oscillospiraceae bacterium]
MKKSDNAHPGRQLGVLDLAHRFLRSHVQPGDLCIDATAGRGFDTKLLCELTGETGRVLAFDIQEEAVESTRKLLADNGLTAEVHLESHANLGNFAEAGTVSCIVFNFGWLPRGSHEIFTHADSSIAALEASLRLLRVGGALSLCVYYGGANGFTERDALLDWLSALDSRYFTVLKCDFPNRTGCPPFAVFVTKDSEPSAADTQRSPE